MKKKISDELLVKAVGGCISCAEARKIAEDAGVPYGEVGTAADELHIKITGCELGCF